MSIRRVKLNPQKKEIIENIIASLVGNFVFAKIFSRIGARIQAIANPKAPKDSIWDRYIESLNVKLGGEPVNKESLILWLKRKY